MYEFILTIARASVKSETGARCLTVETLFGQK